MGELGELPISVAGKLDKRGRSNQADCCLHVDSKKKIQEFGKFLSFLTKKKKLDLFFSPRIRENISSFADLASSVPLPLQNNKFHFALGWNSMGQTSQSGKSLVRHVRGTRFLYKVCSLTLALICTEMQIKGAA